MTKKILIVDDDPDVRVFNSSVVEDLGYTPIEASNGVDGLNMVKKERPDLVLLDVMMPKQTGLRMYRELMDQKALKHIPVVIVSGIAKKTFLRSQKALTEFGGSEVPEPSAYLEKPVDPEVLADTIKKFLA
ncbi:MAG: response regulator [Deltaproteobacteria bacterium]|nr:response regulator [Deltaproteobacteria bacterium]